MLCVFQVGCQSCGRGQLDFLVGESDHFEEVVGFVFSDGDGHCSSIVVDSEVGDYPT